MANTKIKVNRAPVMTLWAAVVGERLGFSTEEALSLAKAVTGLNAQAKGQRLGIYQPSTEEDRQEVRRHAPNEVFFIQLLGRSVPAVITSQGLRAVAKEAPIDPAAVQRYLEKKFGQAYPEVRSAMQELAASFSPEELGNRAYALYEKFRPQIPEGVRGWGAEGVLDLQQILFLRSRRSSPTK